MSSFNIKPEDGKFIVNKEKRTVVWVIEETERLFLDFVEDNFVVSPWMVDYGLDSRRTLYAKMMMPNRFVGIAKCTEGDEWNEEIGKLIAFSDAKDKINRSFFKRAKTYVSTLDRYIDDAVDIINRLGEKISQNTDHRHNYIESLIGPEPEQD